MNQRSPEGGPVRPNGGNISSWTSFLLHKNIRPGQKQLRSGYHSDSNLGPHPKVLGISKNRPIVQK